MSDEGMLEQLHIAENANIHARPCQVCDALAKMSEEARIAVRAALAGTIGERKLSKILTGSGYIVGRRAIILHRREGHS